jgi:hypothetical protein
MWIQIQKIDLILPIKNTRGIFELTNYILTLRIQITLLKCTEIKFVIFSRLFKICVRQCEGCKSDIF